MLRSHEDLVEGNWYHLVIEGGGQRLTLLTKYERADVGTRPHILHVYPFDFDSNWYGMTDDQMDANILLGIVYEA